MSRALYALNGRAVATFDGVDVVKTVDQARHQLKHPPAWAFDEIILSQAREFGARHFVIKTRDTRRTYTVGVETFGENCRSFDRGFGVQVFLPLSFWECESLDNRQARLAL